jgi:predicted RNase H-like nuclease (RuvC/YqgF family)
VSFRYHRHEETIVRNTVLATAVAAALSFAAPDSFAAAAASKADLQALEAKMTAMAERLTRLEATNATLVSENAALKATVERRDAEMDYLKAQTRDLREEGAVASNELSKVKGADWATKIKFKGDLRFRDENIEQ